VSDRDNCAIRKITPDGAVTTLAGGTYGSNDGNGSAAQFGFPLGLAIDGAGNICVADEGNYTIRKISPSGNVTTVAGTAAPLDTLTGQGAVPSSIIQTESPWMARVTYSWLKDL